MSNSNLIQDRQTRDAVKELEKFKDDISKIKPLSADSSLKQVIDTINKITNSIKRR
jgi:hypothetical protein